MSAYLARRLFYSIAVVVGVSVAVFLITHQLGDPVRMLLPLEASEEQYQAARQQLGFNDPILVQFARFSVDAVRGDFGDSLWMDAPALPLVLERLPATFLLAGTSIIIALVLAVPLGIIAALKPRSLLDHVASLTALLGLSIADFWLGLMLIFIFPVSLGLFYTSGYGTWEHLVLPAVTLAARPLGRISQIVRSSVLDELDKNYVTAARARGLSEQATLLGHALRNAAIPIVTLTGFELTRLLAGFTVVVEAVFGWPGVGLLAVDAIERQDLPLLQADVFVVAMIVVVINLLIDLLYGALDPRIRY
ncbi:MAG: ABC transporter permease [Anaerolineae bacterium]|nr:ABC transporter permease [Anaerolineae bacterium]